MGFLVFRLWAPVKVMTMQRSPLLLQHLKRKNPETSSQMCHLWLDPQQKKTHTQKPPPCVGLENNHEPLPYTWGCSAAAVSIVVWLLVHDSPTSAHSGQVKAVKTPKVESKEPELSGFGFGVTTWGWLEFFFGGCDCVMVTWNGRHVIFFGKSIDKLD